MDLNYILTSPSGRIPRSQWWAGILILVAISVVINLLLTYAFGIIFTTIGRLILLIVQLLLAYPFFAVSAKRFQDRDKPGSLAWVLVGVSILSSLLTLVGLMGRPFQPSVLDWIFGLVSLVVAVWYIVELGILRGTVGTNTYGPDPLGGTE